LSNGRAWAVFSLVMLRLLVMLRDQLAERSAGGMSAHAARRGRGAGEIMGW
jgi:hypothetical protein